ncbi:MAG TPA: MXAN_5187 C-terminal domain-containing protein [Polyangiales bacterium]|jgi:hypothetical protein|nr:MXAN_5187 C-terminal domain-containing protein [Polyangiales bacterium]
MEQKQFEATLHDAEIRLRRLKTLYDQWLAGFERLEPTVPRAELDTLLQTLKREQIRNTALRFRLQQVSQRYLMLVTYWKRIGRQMEEGTYQRDVLRARKLKERQAREQREDGARPDGAYDVDVDVDLDSAMEEASRAAQEELDRETSAVSKLPEGVTTKEDLEMPMPLVSSQPQPSAPMPSAAPTPAAGKMPPPAVPPRAAVAARSISPFAMPLPPGAKPGAPPPPPGPPAAGGMRAPPPPVPSAGARPGAVTSMGAKPAAPAASAAQSGNGGLSNDDVQRIYAKYVAARKDNAERTDNVRLENIEKSLRGMLPQLEKKHAGKKIDFEVVVKDGKVALKPVAK